MNTVILYIFSSDPAKWVLLGEFNKQSTADDKQGLSDPTLFEIIERFEHPDFSTINSMNNDIALFRLDRDVEFNKFIRPTCLHTKHQLPETDVMSVGWGSIDFGKYIHVCPNYPSYHRMYLFV